MKLSDLDLDFDFSPWCYRSSWHRMYLLWLVVPAYALGTACFALSMLCVHAHVSDVVMRWIRMGLQDAHSGPSEAS